MGVKSVLGLDPVEEAKRLIGDPGEKQRRADSMTRLCLYQDDLRESVVNHVGRIFQSGTIKKLVEPHIAVCASSSFYRRIINEISAHVYSITPRRMVYTELPETIDVANPPENVDQKNFNKLANDAGLDAAMDTACRLSHSHNDLLLYFRWVDRLEKIVIEKFTPGQCSVISDPDDATKILALIYQNCIWRGGKQTIGWTYVDDEVSFSIANDEVVSYQENKAKRLDVVPVHTGLSHHSFWDRTTGSDLVHAQILCATLYALIGKLHKSQSFKQQTIFGDINQVAKKQLRDDESALILPIGSSVQVDDMATPPSHFFETINNTVTQVAANYGISRERLNQVTRGVSAEPGLLERRQQAIRVFRDVETRVFETIRALSAITKYPIDEAARFQIDFAEVEALADKKTRLEIWSMEEERGLRNVLDDIAEVSPEFQTDKERLAEYERNVQLWGLRREKARELNAPADGSAPGLMPEQNGAAGPVARDLGQVAAKQMLDSMGTTYK